MTEAEAKLVRMAGEIHQFFRHQGEASILAAANHIRQFWSPAMRNDFIAAAAQEGAEVPDNINQIAVALSAGS